MKCYISDTHPLVWYTVKPQLLSRKVLKIFDDCDAGRALIYLPAPVLWEMSLLLHSGSIALKIPFSEWFKRLSKNKSYVLLPLEPEMIVEYSNLFLADNEDPFDRLIVSYAMQFDSPLITADESIHATKLIQTVW